MTRQPTVEVAMLIRVAPERVYEAFSDPTLTTRFWFTDSTGPLVPGARVTWEWGTVGATVPVEVLVAEPPKSLRVRWGNGDHMTTVNWSIVPHADGTWVHITESGFQGTEQEIAARIVDSIGGFDMAVAAAKVLLEHGIDSRLVADSMPAANER